MLNCGQLQTTRKWRMACSRSSRETPMWAQEKLSLQWRILTMYRFLADTEEPTALSILCTKSLFVHETLLPADYPHRNAFFYPNSGILCSRSFICFMSTVHWWSLLQQKWHTQLPQQSRFGVIHAIYQSRHQHNFSLNVWAAIHGDEFIGPVFLPPRLNGNSYLNFLQNELFDYLEDLPVAARQCMWFMHDDAPSHFSVQVRDYLTAQFGNQWIGRGGPVTWPARSPDLNLIDIFETS